MKKVLIVFILLLTCNSVFAYDTYVSGYYRKNGTYVEPHYKTKSDNYSYNNYSSQGNVNPYTFKSGTVNPYPINTTPVYHQPRLPKFNNTVAPLAEGY